MSSYIGDLDVHVADILSNPIARGLLRLEGFIQRLQPEAVSGFFIPVTRKPDC